ncbi:MAG: GNAT family N-acetyltransferase [Pseudomonadota bacterium]
MSGPRGRAGETVLGVRTYLEMTERPTTPPLHAPAGIRLSILAATEPPAAWFLYLYQEVGRDWEWVDWLRVPLADVEAFVGDPLTSVHTMMLDGWPAGFFMLDTRHEGTCDLAYFGLTPQAVGRGLGRWFLDTAIRTGWDRAGVVRMTVNTCTLDHPAALGLYQRMGFTPIAREEFSHELTRDFNT